MKEQCVKRSYRTKKKAWEFCLHYFINYGFRNRPYKCKNCQLYHLTTRNPDGDVSKEFIDGFNKWFGSKIL